MDYNLEYPVVENNGTLEIEGNATFYRIDMTKENTELIVGGDFGMWNQSYCNITAGTVIFDGTERQTVNNINAPTIVIKNKSDSGVQFNTTINVTELFDHQGNKFEIYSGSKFADYDGDGLDDNLDFKPTIYNPKNDVDFNGTISATDLVELKKIILNAIAFGDMQKSRIDVNEDGAVNILDLVRLKKQMAG